MLIAALHDLDRYAPQIEGLAQALAWLRAHPDAPVGKYPLENGFLMIQEGATKPMAEGDFEAHRKYLDVQILLSGAEEVLWADLDELTPTDAYDAQSDKIHFRGEGSLLRLRPGTCYLCWPRDGHKACRTTGAPGPYRKAVVKLPL